MTNEIAVQVHTNKVMPGAECFGDDGDQVKLCNPMAQAARREWFVGMKEPKTLFAVGDMELRYLSVLNFCPFCGVDFRKVIKGYLQHHEGPPEVLGNAAKG